jgi:gluconokinase
MITQAPLLLVVMGVSGAGKSTFTKAISQALDFPFMDGDDLHSLESVAKMQAGLALQDEDRWPWLDRVAGYLAQGSAQGDAVQGRVVACSALKRAYRDRIRLSLPGVQFIFLNGDRELIRTRMAARKGHFMQLELLDSQLRTLESPGVDEKDVMVLDTANPIDQLVKEATTVLLAQRSVARLDNLQTH